MAGLLILSIILALIPAINTLANLALLRTPPLPAILPRVAILIPARNEQVNIGGCVDAALASVGADIEVIVLDDGSTDNTKEIVLERRLKDPRVSLASAPPLPLGWKGKAHACHILSTLTDRPFLLFIDADVTLTPTAAARLVPPERVDLLSGVPRQRVESLLEKAVVPMINSLIFCYLPAAFMRMFRHPSLSAACGQMLMVRASAYRVTGGHASIAGFMHDGMQLARLFRRKGFHTDLVDGTHLARCRMYDSAGALMNGFMKNATEGMARPVALPIWTILLAGGHLLPLIAIMLAIGSGTVFTLFGLAAFCAYLLLIAARILQAIKCQEPWQAVLLHPAGVVLTLFIQWRALYNYFTGSQVEWRGRSYAPNI